MFFRNVQPDIYSGCAYQIFIGWEIFAYMITIQVWQVFKDDVKKKVTCLLVYEINRNISFGQVFSS